MSQSKKVLLGQAFVDSGKNGAVFAGFLREKSLRKGYEEMALINLSLAEMSLNSDNDALRKYEEKLTECE